MSIPTTPTATGFSHALDEFLAEPRVLAEALRHEHRHLLEVGLGRPGRGPAGRLTAVAGR